MSSFTDPTQSTGSSSSSNSDIGGFFDMGDVDGIGSGYGAGNGYSPSAVQEMITQLLTVCGPHMSEFQMVNLMWLMQEYGNQDVGVDATNQTSMNQFFGDVQNLWGELYAGNTVTPSAGVDAAWQNTVFNMATALSQDPFFKNSPEGQQMLNQILGALNSADELVQNVQDAPPGEHIWAMWQQYNGCPNASGVPTVSGSPDTMDSMMRELGQLNQDVTGVSQSIGTQFQSDSNNQQSESGALNNYLQMLYKMIQALVQNTQATG